MKVNFKLYILLIAAGIISCKENKQGIDKAAPASDTTAEKTSIEALTLTDEQLNSFKLDTGSLQKRSLSQTIRVNGKIDVWPDNFVSMSNALGGYVKSIKLLAGMSFKKGDVLAVMEDNQYIQLQQDYLTTKAQLKSAKLNYERQKELNNSKASSDKTYQVAEAEYETLLVTQKALEEKLKFINIDPDLVSVNRITRTINIYAPFNGTVSQVLVNKGKYASPQDVLFELINSSHLLLNLKVFEKDIPFLTKGQSLKAFTNTNPDQLFDAEIISISEYIKEDGSADVYARLKSGNEKLVKGTYMNASIETKKHLVYTLPDDAVVSFEGNNYIFEVESKNQFYPVSVQTGASDENYTEILNHDSLQEKKIVTKGAYTILMSLKNKTE